MSQEDLFGENRPQVSAPPKAPLAARMRPRTFEEFVGQEHLTGPDAALRKLVEADKLASIILWGPPGVGKTTLAEVIANFTNAHFARVSATSAGVADLRKIIEEARRLGKKGQRTILFIDEIHRFNKAQQDAILPVVEDGTVVLIGATTENPSFEVISALLSRCRVYTMRALSDEEIGVIVRRSLEDENRGLGNRGLILDDEAVCAIVNLANGDARSALNILEMASDVAARGVASGPSRIAKELVESAAQRRVLLYDKAGEMHFDLISALHKSVRGSDPDASLYWLARMLESGEDPLYLARRIVRMASEDVGLAEPQALPICMAAQQAVHFIGMPEGALALAEAVVFLAIAPKSNALYRAYGQAAADVQDTRNEPVPLHLRNAPTGLMKDLGYGKGYRYAHDFEEAIVEQQNLPDSIAGRTYYTPSNRGFEEEIGKRLEFWQDLVRRRGQGEKG